MFRRLRIRLTLFCTAIAGLILAGMSVLSLILAQNTLAQRGEATLARDMDPVLYSLSTYLNSESMIDHGLLAKTEVSGKVMIYLEDSGNPMLFAGSWHRELRDRALPLAKEVALEKLRFDIGAPPGEGAESSQVVYSYTNPQGESYCAVAAVLPMKRGWVGLVLVRPMAEEQAEAARLRAGYAILTAAALVLLFGASWVFTGWVIRPIEENRRRQMEFVSAASHELRSPLAVIEASTAATMSAPPDRARQFQDTVLQECHRMSRLIGDMLLLAGADNRSWSIHKAPAEPETMLLDAAESFEGLAAKKNIHIAVTLPEAPLPRCECDAQRIAQVLAVLLDNAVSYIGRGGRIELTVRQCRDRLELRVRDNGPGVPDQYKKEVFNRFRRLDASRTQKEHYGLGLSVAWEIAALHKGALWVEDAPGGGAVFVLSLPIS